MIPASSLHRWTAVLLALVVFTPQGAAGQENTTRWWQITPSPDGTGSELILTEAERPEPGPGEVLVRVRASSLNARDLSMLGAERRVRSGEAPRIPLSDGAGEVVAVGPGVTRFEVGSRVAGTFVEHWPGSRRTPEANASAP